MQESIESPALDEAAPEVMAPGVEVREIRMTDGGALAAPFRAARFVVRPGAATDVDEHVVRECWMVTDGEGTLVYEGRPMPVGAGQAFLFDPFSRHQLRNDGREDLVVLSLWWGD